MNMHEYATSFPIPSCTAPPPQPPRLLFVVHYYKKKDPKMLHALLKHSKLASCLLTTSCFSHTIWISIRIIIFSQSRPKYNTPTMLWSLITLAQPAMYEE